MQQQELWRIDKDRICGFACVKIIGPFNFSHTEISSIIKEYAAAGEKDLVMDLRETSFFTSQGLASIIVVLKHVSTAGGRLFILGPTEDMQKVFRLTMLERVLLIAEDEAGLAALAKQ